MSTIIPIRTGTFITYKRGHLRLRAEGGGTQYLLNRNYRSGGFIEGFEADIESYRVSVPFRKDAFVYVHSDYVDGLEG